MKTRTAIGIGLILSSFVMFASGTYLGRLTLDEKLRAERQIDATNQQCLRILNTVDGATVTPLENEVTLIIPTVRDPRKTLTDATVALLMCPNMSMDEVCLGDQCQGANEGDIGLKLVLKKVK